MSTQLPQGLSAATVEAIADARDEPTWLRDRRQNALEALSELSLPEVIKTPGREWTDFDALPFEELVDPDDPLGATETTRSVTTDADAVSVMSMATAIDEHEELLEATLGEVLEPTQNYLTALSAALFTTGTVVHVPAGVDAGEVTIRTTVADDTPSVFGHTLVIAEESASATILQRTDASEAPAHEEQYVSNLVEIVGEENSTVQFGAIQDVNEATYVYTHKRGQADAYANIEWIEGNFGSRLTRSDVETVLDGEGSQSRIVGAFFGHEDQHFDINARVWHEAAHTTADLATRGVLDDTARSVYEGLQHVGRDAWDTSSYQRENTLMLSDASEADASPKLIINNHDTEASHSASVGQVDEEDLFYLVSRGIDEETAVDTLVEGFFVPVLEEVNSNAMESELTTLIEDRLDG